MLQFWPMSSFQSSITHTSAIPYLDSQRAWWDALPEDFSSQHEDFVLKGREKWLVRGTAALDNILRSGAAAMVSTLAVPQGFRPSQIKAMMSQRGLYDQYLMEADLQKVFVRPPRGVKITQIPPTKPYFTPESGTCVDLMFTSPYQTLHPDLQEAYSSEPFNRMAHGRLWQHYGAPRPTVIAIHGFTADPYWLNEWFFALPWLYAKGYNVMLYTLPFHGPRRMRFSPYSGHGFFAGGLSWLNEAVLQAVHDFRIFADYLLEEIGVPQIGVTGISLGGYHTAILAAVEERLAFAVPNVPVVSLADIMLEWQPAGAAVRALMSYTGMTLPEVRRTMAIHNPLTWKPALPPERLMLIGGVADRLAPPKHTRLLWEHWNHCHLYWFPGSHIIHFDRSQYLREMANLFDRIRFLPSPIRS